MAISVYKTFSAGEVLTAADLNASFTQIVNNGTDVAFPLTKNSSLAGFTLFTDAANTKGFVDSAKGLNLALAAFNDAKTTVASDTTPDIWTSTGGLIDYTGTATATGFAAAPQAGAQRSLLCAGASVFTCGANMLIDSLPIGVDYTATAGDIVDVIAVTTTQFRLKPRPYPTKSPFADIATNDFRLTLTSGSPVTTSDVTAAETLYLSPTGGNKIALYDGANWLIRASGEVSIDVPDVTGVYDVFVYDNSGTPTLEVLVWSNETTRATALTRQNGVLVKNGDATRRYVGTFYSTTAGNGQIEDSLTNRYLWNYYNRVSRPMRRVETTATWANNSVGIRQANGSTDNQVNFVIGVSEDVAVARCHGMTRSNTIGDVVDTLIGLDSTAVRATGSLAGAVFLPVANYVNTTTASYTGFPGIGKHYLAWLEQVEVGAGTITWLGNAGAGIHAEILG